MNQPPVVPIKWLSLDDESNMYKRPRSPETFQSSKKKKIKCNYFINTNHKS